MELTCLEAHVERAALPAARVERAAMQDTGVQQQNVAGLAADHEVTGGRRVAVRAGLDAGGAVAAVEIIEEGKARDHAGRHAGG